MKRRQFVGLATAGAAGALTGCLDGLLTVPNRRVTLEEVTLATRPRAAPSSGPTPGLRQLSVSGSTASEGIIYIPSSYDHQRATAVAVLLHDRAMSSMTQWWHTWFTDLLDDLRVVLVAPESRRLGWEVSAPDAVVINAALDRVFDLCHVDAARIAIGGFGDGASAGLSFGLANGDLFTHLVGFTPGYLRAPDVRGKPKVYISQGSTDTISAPSASEAIANELRRLTYTVTYDVFTGGHAVPPDIARTGLTLA
jgi:phospholipase/carboxylesterase